MVDLGDRIREFIESGDGHVFQSLVSDRRDIPTRRVKEIFLACRGEEQRRIFWFRVVRRKGLPTEDLEEIIQKSVGPDGKPSVYAELARMIIANRALRYSPSCQSA